MICLNTNVAQLLSFDFWNDRADIFMMVIAAIALVFTILQLRSNRKESRRATAYSTYQEYLTLCFENPKLAYGNQTEMLQSGQTNPKYPWFVSQMLFTFEQILETDKYDEQWKTSIKSQLKRHAWYLKKSNTANRQEWNKELKAIIQQVTTEAHIQNQETLQASEVETASA